MLFTVQLTDQLPLVKPRQGLIVWPIWLTNQYQNATNLTNLLAWAPSPPAHSATTQHTRGLSQQQVGTSLSGRLNNVHTHLTHTHTHTLSDTLASDYAIWKRFVVSFFFFFSFFIWFFDLIFGLRCVVMPRGQLKVHDAKVNVMLSLPLPGTFSPTPSIPPLRLGKVTDTHTKDTKCESALPICLYLQTVITELT